MISYTVPSLGGEVAGIKSATFDSGSLSFAAAAKSFFSSAKFDTTETMRSRERLDLFLRRSLAPI